MTFSRNPNFADESAPAMNFRDFPSRGGNISTGFAPGSGPKPLALRSWRGFNRSGRDAAYIYPPYAPGDLFVLLTAWTHTDGGGGVTSFTGLNGGGYNNPIRHNNYWKVSSYPDDEFDGAWQRTSNSFSGKLGWFGVIQGYDFSVGVETSDIASIGVTSFWVSPAMASSVNPADWDHYIYVIADSISAVTVPTGFTSVSSFVVEDLTCVVAKQNFAVGSSDVATWGIEPAQNGWAGSFAVPAGTDGGQGNNPPFDSDWDNVGLLMGFNWNVNSNQAAFDASSYNRNPVTWNGGGPTLVNSPVPPFGPTWANDFGENGWVAWGTGVTSHFTPTDDFTLDVIFNINSWGPSRNNIVGIWGQFSTEHCWLLYCNTQVGLTFTAQNSDNNKALDMISSFYPTLGSIYHARVDCNSGNANLYIGVVGAGVGSLVATDVRCGTIRYLPAEQLSILGQVQSNSSFPLKGQAKELRWTHDKARSAGAGFVPVNSQFPRWSGL